MKDPANRKRRPPSARSNHTFPDTLGKCPIVVRSLVCVGGTRPGRRYWKRGSPRGSRPPAVTPPYFGPITLHTLFPMLAAAFVRRGLR